MDKKGRTYLKQTGKIIGTAMTILLAVIAALLCFSIRWMFDTWSNLTMDELVYHITAPLEGTNEGMILEYLNVCVVPTILVLLFLVILLAAWRKKRRYYALMSIGIVGSLILSGTVVRGAWNELDVGNYVKSQGSYSTFIDDYYVDPEEVEISFPDQKRNLIYIFLESMETTYADQKNGGAFEKNVIPELTKLAQQSEDFSGETDQLNGGYAMPGATWTMGAMFAQTSGLPLNISISSNYMDTQDHFFASTTTLGDILEKEGYSQTLLIGSEAKFGGRELYFTEHGNYDMVDYTYASQTGMIPAGYRVFWGYEDQKLFGFAKEKLLELAGQDTPFNLTMLTVDTHFEDGYPCESCPDMYEDQYSNVMACSSRQVEEFIEWIRQQDFYENTTIVLAGDHPTMDSDFCENIESDYERKVYTAYLNSPVKVETASKREYTTFDMFPTTVASLGAVIEGDQLGLGTNLFSSKQTLIERFGIPTMKNEIGRKSKLMEELADIDENKEEILARDGKLPAADIAVDSYQFQSGALPVTVSNIRNVKGEIQSLQLAVWTAEDQSDLQWILMEQGEDGNYHVNINIPGFNYQTGEYQIHAYAVDSDGEETALGNAVGMVE